MNPETKYNIKAFLWDQLVRPVCLLMNTSFFKIIFLVMIFASIIIFKSIILFFTFLLATLLIYLYDLVKYYKSGEYKANYRKYKYPEYRKAIKEIKKSKHQTHTVKVERPQEVSELNKPPFKTPVVPTQDNKNGE